MLVNKNNTHHLIVTWFLLRRSWPSRDSTMFKRQRRYYLIYINWRWEITDPTQWLTDEYDLIKLDVDDNPIATHASGAGSSDARSVWDANAGTIYNGKIVTTTTTFNFCFILKGETIAITDHFFLFFRSNSIFIVSDTKSPELASVTLRAYSTHKLLLEEQKMTPQVHFGADKAVTEQPQRSRSETVIPIWTCSGTVRLPQPGPQPLVYPPQQMTTPQTIVTLQSIETPRSMAKPQHTNQFYSSLVSAPWPQQEAPQSPPYRRPTSTENYLCTDSSAWCPRPTEPGELTR